jgi:hypothetical protein
MSATLNFSDSCSIAGPPLSGRASVGPSLRAKATAQTIACHCTRVSGGTRDLRGRVQILRSLIHCDGISVARYLQRRAGDLTPTSTPTHPTTAHPPTHYHPPPICSWPTCAVKAPPLKHVDEKTTKRWRKRFFVLRRSMFRLSYYAKENDLESLKVVSTCATCDRCPCPALFHHPSPPPSLVMFNVPTLVLRQRERP